MLKQFTHKKHTVKVSNPEPDLEAERPYLIIIELIVTGTEQVDARTTKSYETEEDMETVFDSIEQENIIDFIPDSFK